MSELDILAPFGALFSFLATGLASGLRLAVLRGRDVGRSSRAWVMVGLAPSLVALLACLALASPTPFSACHCTAHGSHHPHV